MLNRGKAELSSSDSPTCTLTAEMETMANTANKAIATTTFVLCEELLYDCLMKSTTSCTIVRLIICIVYFENGAAESVVDNLTSDGGYNEFRSFQRPPSRGNYISLKSVVNQAKDQTAPDHISREDDLAQSCLAHQKLNNPLNCEIYKM